MKKQDDKVSAIIVLYLPNRTLLLRLLKSILGQVKDIIVIDNTPKADLGEISADWFKLNGYVVLYKSLEDNYGIAKAQNIGIELAVEKGCDHVVLFDQDSCPSTGMIHKLLLAEKTLSRCGVNVGSIGPAFIDEKTSEYAKVIRHKVFGISRISINRNSQELIQADYIIASGSLIRVSTIKTVGLMMEELFIDGVDIEWCLRARNYGFLHFVVPGATMHHQIGDEFFEIFGKKINLHSDLRNYYIVRNSCYLTFNSKLYWRFRFNLLLKIPIYFLMYIFTSKSSFFSSKLLLRACFDGVLGKLGRAF